MCSRARGWFVLLYSRACAAKASKVQQSKPFHCKTYALHTAREGDVQRGMARGLPTARGRGAATHARAVTVTDMVELQDGLDTPRGTCTV